MPWKIPRSFFIATGLVRSSKESSSCSELKGACVSWEHFRCFMANIDKQLIKSKLSSNSRLVQLSLVLVQVLVLFSGSLRSGASVTTSKSLAGASARLTRVGWQGAGRRLPSPYPSWPTTKVAPARTVILDRGSLSGRCYWSTNYEVVSLNSGSVRVTNWQI